APRSGTDARGAAGFQVGAGNIQHNYFMTRPDVVWPHRVGVMPPEADCFQHRDLAMRVNDVLSAGESVVLTQVLSGLGGVGKTQLAASIARRLWHEQAVDLLVWVPASSRQVIVAAYAQAAAEVTTSPGGDAEQ